MNWLVRSFIAFIVAVSCAFLPYQLGARAQDGSGMPMRLYGQGFWGATLPYGKVVVPKGHEVQVKIDDSLGFELGGIYLWHKRFSPLLYSSLQRIDLALFYDGPVVDTEYAYRSFFWETGMGIHGLIPRVSILKNMPNLFYEGGLFYGMALGDGKLYLDGTEQDDLDLMEYGDSMGVFVGSGVKLALPDPQNRLFLRVGLRYQLNLMPVIRGDSGLVYGEEEDKLRYSALALRVGVIYHTENFFRRLRIE